MIQLDEVKSMLSAELEKLEEVRGNLCPRWSKQETRRD